LKPAYEVFEQLPSGAVVLRAEVLGLEQALVAMKQIFENSGNEAFFYYPQRSDITNGRRSN